MQELAVGSSNKVKWKSRYTVLSFIWFAWMVSYLDRMVMNISLPFIGQDLGLDKTTQGFVISAFFVGYAAFQIPGGYIADKYGPRISMAIAIIWWSVFTSLTGFMTALGTLLAIRFLFGIGEGAFPAASWKTISMYFPSHERGRATAIQTSVSTLEPALAAIVAAAIIQWLGWRHVFIILGFPGIIIAAGLFYYCRNNPKDTPNITAEEVKELEDDNILNATSSSQSISFMEVLKQPVLWQFTLIWLLFNTTFWGFTTWLPSYLMDARGLSLAKTGVLSAIPFLCGTVGTLAGGYVSDKFKDIRTWIYACSAVVSAGFLYLTYTVEDLTQAMVYQCLSATLMFFAVGLFWGLLMDNISKNIMGTASGVINVGAQIAGIISPPIMGYLIQSSGGNYNSAFMFIILALITSAIVMLTLKTKKREKTV